MTATIAVGDATSNLLNVQDFNFFALELTDSTKVFSINVAQKSTDTPRPYYYLNSDSTDAVKLQINSTGVRKVVELPENLRTFKYLQVVSDSTAHVTAITSYLDVAI
jgi:hypothetical protein